MRTYRLAVRSAAMRVFDERPAIEATEVEQHRLIRDAPITGIEAA
jgi:hypothetical protein